MLSAGSIMMSCQSKTYNKETNITTNQFTMKEQFPNHQTAFEKINDEIIWYNPTGDKLFMIDLKKSLFTTYQPDIDYSLYLFKVNDFLYFSPKIIKENSTFATGNVGTGMGVFSTEKMINDLGLIEKEKIEYPNDDGKMGIYNVTYSYNKFAQLLKIKQDRDIILEYKYDENAKIIEAETPKGQRKFKYNNEAQIDKEEITNKNGSKNILNYRYNSSKQIEKKYNDDETLVKEYQYDSNKKLISIIEYSGIIDKNDPSVIINHFIKKSYTYNADKVIEEKQYEYNIASSSVVVNHKRIPITIAEQKKVAWQKLRDQSEIPLSGIEKKYSYQSNEINVGINKYSFSITLAKGKSEKNKELLDSETIKYRLDNIGRIIKQEVYNKKELVKTQEFYY